MKDLFDARLEGLMAATNQWSPASAGRPVQDTAAPRWMDWRGSGCILVVDDEETVRTVVTRAVVKIGFTANSASGGPEAISLFKSDPGIYALVLLDLRLPGMDGGEIIRNLRQVRPDVPVILMSGYGTQEALAQLIGQNISGFLHKPFTLQALALKLRAVLDP
jgi:two-component system, cell cycle sensor histidine kinase and response regulator CckA